jgi:hypothetical protein
MSIFARSDLTIAVHPGPLPAGARFGVRVDIPEVDEKVQGGTVQLCQVSTYREHHEETCSLGESCRRSGGGSRYHSHTETRTTVDRSVQQEHDLFSGPPAPLSRVFDFDLPDDASPSVPHLLSWQVRVEVPRWRGRDRSEQVELQVVGTPETVLTCQHEQPVLRGPNPMTVQLRYQRFHRGGLVEGTVTVHPTVPLQTRGLRVQLTRVVSDILVAEQHATVEALLPITGAFGYLPGQPFQVPFAIAFPPDPSPCCTAVGRAQHWYLEIVADVPFGEDELVRVPLALT